MAPEGLSISNLELTLYETPTDSTLRYLDGVVVTSAATDITGALQVSAALPLPNERFQLKEQNLPDSLISAENIFWAINSIIPQDKIPQTGVGISGSPGVAPVGSCVQVISCWVSLATKKLKVWVTVAKRNSF